MRSSPRVCTLVLFIFFAGESTLKPNITDAYFVRDPNSEEVSVFYKWDYPNFREILGYNVKTFLDGQPISSISLPKASVDGSHNVHLPNEGELSLEIEAVDHCKKTHSSEVFTVSRKYYIYWYVTLES